MLQNCRVLIPSYYAKKSVSYEESVFWCNREEPIVFAFHFSVRNDVPPSYAFIATTFMAPTSLTMISLFYFFPAV